MEMNLDTGTLVAGFIISTIGFSLFLYGKKQGRPAPLVTGILFMALPMLVHDALWMSLSAGLMIVGMRVAIERES